jgi:hypothetical protein
VNCKQKAFVIDPLRQAVKNTRNQQHMAILYRTNIDGNNTGRILRVNRHAREELNLGIFTSFKLEEQLFLANFSEVEFAAIKRLQHLIYTELSWPLLQVTTLVKLSNETILPRDNFGFAGSDIIAKKSSLEPILPLSENKGLEKSYRRLYSLMTDYKLLSGFYQILTCIQWKPSPVKATSAEAIPSTADGILRSIVLLVVRNNGRNSFDFQHSQKRQISKSKRKNFPQEKSDSRAPKKEEGKNTNKP